MDRHPKSTCPKVDKVDAGREERERRNGQICSATFRAQIVRPIRQKGTKQPLGSALEAVRAKVELILNLV